MFTTERYKIQLPQFEGPFDLLLFFIERDELDIYDIPIAKITNDFLDYIHQMEALNVDVASEFILVAATLMRIKARVLIPRKELDEEGNEIDPRMELVEKLLEYKRYKSVLDQMRQLEQQRALREKRGYTSKELKQIAVRALVDVELESLTMFKLMKAFQRVLDKMEARKSKTIHRVYAYNYTIQDQARYIRQTVRKERTRFETLFGHLENRIHAIITFMALLELLNRMILTLIPGEGINNFWVQLNPDAPEEEPDIQLDWGEQPANGKPDASNPGKE